MLRLPPLIETPKDETDAVLVPGGAFNYGVSQDRVKELLQQLKETPDPIFETEFPHQTVEIRDCYIDKFPVTNRRYDKFIRATKHPAPLYWADLKWGGPDQPVVGISYRDAQAYAAWADKRLPTEEEWERAARGTDERIWPWGNEFDSKRCNSREWSEARTTPVGRFATGASPTGAHDMAGNVWELTSGNWEGFGKAIRGGSYKNSAIYCRCTCRHGIDPDLKGSTWLGFRCAMDVAKARIYAKAKPL
jgi:formylglycine-generating enzyme required for sulfatase activity